MIERAAVLAERERLESEIKYFEAEIYERQKAIEVVDTMLATVPEEPPEQEVARLLRRLEELGYRQTEVEADK